MTHDAVQTLERELRGIFGNRLQSLVVYGESASRHAQARRDEASHGAAHGHDADDDAGAHTLAVVETLTGDDLRACAGRVAAWHEAGLATPLVLAAHEFGRSLDAFPLEFGAILADHTVASGANPFQGLTVDVADLRRAVEVHARSHLLHLREGYLETRGRGDALSVLIVQSAPAFAALLTSLARLEGELSNDATAAARHAERLIGAHGALLEEIVKLTGVREISSRDAERLFPPYLDAVERLVSYVDRWKRDGR